MLQCEDSEVCIEKNVQVKEKLSALMLSNESKHNLTSWSGLIFLKSNWSEVKLHNNWWRQHNFYPYTSSKTYNEIYLMLG